MPTQFRNDPGRSESFQAVANIIELSGKAVNAAKLRSKKERMLSAGTLEEMQAIAAEPTEQPTGFLGKLGDTLGRGADPGFSPGVEALKQIGLPLAGAMGQERRAVVGEARATAREQRDITLQESNLETAAQNRETSRERNRLAIERADDTHLRNLIDIFRAIDGDFDPEAKEEARNRAIEFEKEIRAKKSAGKIDPRIKNDASIVMGKFNARKAKSDSGTAKISTKKEENPVVRENEKGPLSRDDFIATATEIRKTQGDDAARAWMDANRKRVK